VAELTLSGYLGGLAEIAVAVLVVPEALLARMELQTRDLEAEVQVAMAEIKESGVLA
jgi:hypothetical protein|tara:strand:- start:1149 stop:1319 length:171 start_codon:yes stop_codon:yes gene_type:complete